MERLQFWDVESLSEHDNVTLRWQIQTLWEIHSKPFRL